MILIALLNNIFFLLYPHLVVNGLGYKAKLTKFLTRFSSSDDQRKTRPKNKILQIRSVLGKIFRLFMPKSRNFLVTFRFLSFLATLLVWFTSLSSITTALHLLYLLTISSWLW